MKNITHLIAHAEGLIDKLEGLFPKAPDAMNWSAVAWRWMPNNGQGFLAPIAFPHRITLDDLHHIDHQKNEIVRNTQQFLRGFTANNVLLTGARGTGKSSIVKALLNEFSNDGLRVVEVEKNDLVDLPAISALLRARKERFIVYCDDLSFETGDASYKALKVMLDGSLEVPADNILIYATSNRKNLLPEMMADNLATQYEGYEVRPNDATEEKVSLADRFGLWLTFYPYDQSQYLTIVGQWLNYFNVAPMTDAIKAEALNWAQTRGARSGRVAYQFARDYAGKLQLDAS